MKELNLHIMDNAYLLHFSSEVISIVRKNTSSEIAGLRHFELLEEVHRKCSSVFTKPRRNQFTGETQQADKKQIECYKAIYYAVKSFLYLPDAEERRAAQSLLYFFKNSPRSLERMSQEKRRNAIQLLLLHLDHPDQQADQQKIGLGRWREALHNATDRFEEASQKFYSEKFASVNKGSSSAFRPELIEAINNFFHYLNALCIVGGDPQATEVKKMIEIEYTDIRTICRRKITRRKNQRAKQSNETLGSNSTELVIAPTNT